MEQSSLYSQFLQPYKTSSGFPSKFKTTTTGRPDEDYPKRAYDNLYSHNNYIILMFMLGKYYVIKLSHSLFDRMC